MMSGFLMTNNQKSQDYEQVLEKIVFDEEELVELKIAIKNYTLGKIQARQLKQKLLQCRGRIVKDIAKFVIFCVDRVRDSGQTPVNRNITDSNQSDLANDQLRLEIAEKNELLEAVAKKINVLVPKAKS